jgi:hypothetical protein
MPRRSREQGLLRIGEIAGLAVQSILGLRTIRLASSPRETIPSLVNTLLLLGCELASGRGERQWTGDFADATGRRARGS